MTIGFCRLELFLPDSESLKHKRGILKGLSARVRNKFNVSVAEVADNDVWQKAVLGVAVVANDSRYANQILSKVVSLVESDPRLQVADYSLEML
jgi:uncharacterized protein YlxP (DUF503 family)